MSDENTNRVICWIGCIALTLIGLHYESVLALVGAMIVFMEAVD